ncbi:MerR family transcriptional regulator [Thermogemmatispora onikobensis]|uniref:MerR family transcriptional regulator n=1 Tax=Thermogemmatispora onikobensis TaxID=732234 RepID=UPI000853C9B3|nr:MerR family transcriptional regulator [Thermogemmatispora onikobensis]
MDDRVLQSIRKHLQQPETWERIRGYLQLVSEKLTVTIGEAAQLFDFTENQLRDWEERGLLRPLRSRPNTGQRRYPPAELEKLAIIRDLINAGYPPGAIPLDIADLWHALGPASFNGEGHGVAGSHLASPPLPLDRRVAQVESAVFWRYFASQALHHALLLLCEDLSRSHAAILLPRQASDGGRFWQPRLPEELARLGESLIGWLSLGRTLHLFLEVAPAFEYPSDFRIQPLLAEGEARPADPTLLIVPRQMHALNLQRPVVQTVRRLLAPLYACADQWAVYFAPDLRNWLYPARAFPRGIDPSDTVLNGLMDLIIALGGQTPGGADRWHCCCLMMPEDPAAPPGQQVLIVMACSRHSPHRAGQSRIFPNESYLYFRALRSPYLLYRPRLAIRDSAGLSQWPEHFGGGGSAVAIPIGCQSGPALGVLYVFALTQEAFSEDDLRLLRLMALIVEDLLLLYRARLDAMQGLEQLVKAPEVVNSSFINFLSENEFIRDLEVLLAHLQQQTALAGDGAVRTGSDMGQERQEEHSPAGASKGTPTVADAGPAELLYLFPLREAGELETLSIIALDIDNQSQIVRRYGELALRNLTQAIGQRIQRQLVDCRLYHIYGGRFYLLLKNISLERARQIAQTLRQALRRPYRVELLQQSVWQLEPPETSVELADVSVRLGVTLYLRAKLVELLQRYATAPTSALAEVRSLIVGDLDQALSLGQEEGGNCVISWDPQAEDRGPHVRRFIRLETPSNL